VIEMPVYEAAFRPICGRGIEEFHTTAFVGESRFECCSRPRAVDESRLHRKRHSPELVSRRFDAETLKSSSRERADREKKKMDPTAVIIWLLIGAAAGWLAGQIMSGGGFGLVGDIVVGIIGAVIAGWLFPFLGLRLGGGIIGEIIAAAIGAIILLFLLRLVKRA